MAENEINVLATEEYEVTMDEVTPIVMSEGGTMNHALLNNRELYDQHPITAITGLRDELDSIEALKTVYSDKRNVANYYKWNDAAYDEYGYFVSIVPDTSEIKICGGTDIFGVSVDGAGFIGGQDATPRDNTYGLIATSGLVDVRCESEVEVGNYVVSNAYGCATKSKSDYGYRVLALENKNGVLYAVISLGVQADRVNALGVEVEVLDSRVTANEENIVSATNLANIAHNKSLEAAESSSVSEEAVKKALESILNSEEKIKEFEQIVESANVAATQAKALAESAVTSSTTLCDQAIDRANDAWAKADEVETETYSLCAKIDKHSVGEYSQAYGLTLEQAQSILELGMIYVPTRHEDNGNHTEKYLWKYVEGEDPVYYERTFTPGYLYEWREIPGSEIGIGWVTVDKNYNETTEVDANEMDPINTSAMAVYFSSIEIAVGDDKNNYAYWYTDSKEVYDINGNTGVYEPYTLYHWENGHWAAVATLKGNVNNRMVSEVYQTTNEITLGVSNTRGCIAALSVSLSDTESKVQDMTKWTTGSDENGNSLSYNLATIDRSANKDGSSIALAVADVNGNKVLNGATIVLNQEGGDSSIYLDADKINFEAGDFTIDANKIDFTSEDFTLDASKIDFTGDDFSIDANKINFEAEDYSINASKITLDGETAFTVPETVEETAEDGTIVSKTVTKINGGNIATGSIKAEHLEAGAIDVGEIDASQITSGTLDADRIGAGTITTTHLAAKSVTSTQISVSDLRAVSASIAGWTINTSSLIKGTLGSDGSIHLYSNTWGANGSINGYNPYSSGYGWALGIGSRFGVTADGHLYASGAQFIDGINIIKGDAAMTLENGYFYCRTTDSSNAGVHYRIGVNGCFAHLGRANSTPPKHMCFGMSSADLQGDGNFYFDNSIGMIVSKQGYVCLSSGNGYGIDLKPNGGTGTLSGTWQLNGASISTSSDKNLKHDITKLEDKYSNLFDSLKPVKFKYNNGTSDRYHTGFIAQEVREATENAGLTTQDFASYVEFENKEDGSRECGLRYEELIALCVNEIQKLKKRVAELEAQQND